MTAASPELDALLGGLATSDDVELAVIQMRLLALGKVDARLPRAVRLSAVSRDVDPVLLGVLRAEDDVSTNTELLTLMSREGLVDHQGDLYRFHDLTRAALVREWKSTPELTAEFGQLNLKLQEHYLSRLELAFTLSADFARISTVIRAANPDRWGRIKAMIDRRISWAVRRAARHGFAADPEHGMAVLRDHADTLLRDDRPTVVEQLLAEAEEFVAAAPDREDHEMHRALLAYYEAGLQRRRDGSDTGKLLAVSRDPHLPDQYRLWALDDLATDYESRLELTNALQLRKELVAMPIDQDRWNAPLWSYNLGRLQWRLQHHREAIIALQRSLDIAREDGCRDDLLAPATSMMAMINSELGQRSTAFRLSIEAYDIVRTAAEPDPAWDRYVCRNLANMLLPVDARASEAAWAQGMTRVPKLSGERIDALAERIYYLGTVGALGERLRAEEQLLDIVEELDTLEVTPGEVVLRRGYSAERANDYRAAAIYYDMSVAEVVASRQPSPDRGIDALYGRARSRLRSGDVEAAASDLDEVERRLEESGWTGRLVGVHLEQARVALRTGRFADCERLLDKAGAGCEPGSWDEAVMHRVRGQLHLARSAWEAADQALAASHRVYTGLGDVAAAAEITGFLVQSAQEREDWPLHNRIVGTLRRQTAALARSAQAAPNSQHLAAATKAAEAMVQLMEPGTSEGSSRRDEVRADMEGAHRRDPKCFWYPLGLSYLLADESLWAEAGEALERALELAPIPCRVPLLHENVLAFSIQAALSAGSVRFESPAEGRQVEQTYHAILNRHLKQVAAGVRRPAAALGALLAALVGNRDHLHASVDAMGRSRRSSDPDLGLLLNQMSSLIPDVESYWRVRRLLAELAAEQPALSSNVGTIEDELDGWLSDWFGLAVEPAEISDPPLTAMRLEIGDSLAPFVDNRIDGGHFLFELVPDLRQRVMDRFGVEVPGLRSRTHLGLAPSEVRVKFDDVLVLRCLLDTEWGAVLEPYNPSHHEPWQLLPVHPLNDQQGPWALVLDVDDADREAAVALPSELALVAILELSMLRHLDLFITVDSTADRVERWRADSELAPQLGDLLRDHDSILALTWALRGLATEAVPLDDQIVLSAIQAVGREGLTSPELSRTVRLGLGDRLPGREESRLVGSLPESFAAAWTSQDSDAEFLTQWLREWIRQIVDEHGTWLTLVVPSEVDRATIRAIIASEEPMIAVLDAREVESAP